MSTDGQLGWIVSWRVPASVTLGQLRSALMAAGLDTELAGDLAPRHALARALRKLEGDRIIRRLRQTPAGLTFQLNRIIDQGTVVEYPLETDVVLHDDGHLSCPDNDILRDANVLMIDAFNVRVTGDLTRLVQRVFDRNKGDLIPIREQGGAYFVPDSHGNLVDSVRTLLTGIGGSLRSFAVKLGSGETSSSVAESLSDYLLGCINELRQNVAALEKPTASTLERRSGAINELRQKLSNYHGLLLGLAGSVQTELDNAQAELLKRITEAQNAPAFDQSEYESKVGDMIRG